MPLLVGTDGVQKMSKSLGNYIGITESPKEIFGKIMSISDHLMIDYYELLSDLSYEDLEKLKWDLEKDIKHPREAKAELAREIVARYHGSDAAKKASAEFDEIFKRKGLPDEIPEFQIKWTEEKMWLPKLLLSAEAVPSTSEGRRLIKQGAVTVNDNKITDPEIKFGSSETYLVKVGKKRFVKIIPS